VLTRLTAPTASTVPEVARLAAERFGFAGEADLHLFPFTENWTYRVADGVRDPAVLRIYRPGGRPIVEIQSELAWLAALRAELGELVPEILNDGEGATILEIEPNPPLEPCRCVLFSQAPGSEPADDELRRWFPALGEITGRLHRQARAWTPPEWFSRPRWDIDTTLGEHGHWGPWHASVPDPEERRQLERLATVVVERLARFGMGRERFGLVHADLRLANVLVADEQLTVIDFDDCGFSWYLYDVACALTFNEGRPDVDELIDSWVEGYRGVETLSLEDEHEIKTFLMLRRLMLSAYVGLRPDIELARELSEQRYSAESCRLAEGYLSSVR
jgi:Ser/Thr protein kinase RdoA (MazF antagonist)